MGKTLSESAQRIKNLRLETGLSQSKFSMLFGLPLGNIQHWEQGVANPPDYVADLLCRLYEAEVSAGLWVNAKRKR